MTTRRLYRELKSVEVDQQFVLCRFPVIFYLEQLIIFLIPPENCIVKKLLSFFRFSWGHSMGTERGNSEDYACKMK